MEVSPTNAPACISIPPVIITKVTNNDIIHIEIISLRLPNKTLGIRNLGFLLAKITTSNIKSSTSTYSQEDAFLSKLVFSLFIVTLPYLRYCITA